MFILNNIIVTILKDSKISVTYKNGKSVTENRSQTEKDMIEAAIANTINNVIKTFDDIDEKVKSSKKKNNKRKPSKKKNNKKIPTKRTRFLNPKIVYDIMNMSFEKNKTVQEISKKFPELSNATISRLSSIMVDSSADKYIKMQDYIIHNSPDFETFMNKFWKYFPFPEYWKPVTLSKVKKYYSNHKIDEVIDTFGLKFSAKALKGILDE